MGVGKNSNAQLGDSTTSDSRAPTQIGTGYTAIAAGDFKTVALKSDGTLWAWWYNLYGQLGDGTTTDSLVPKQIVAVVIVDSFIQGFNITSNATTTALDVIAAYGCAGATVPNVSANIEAVWAWNAGTRKWKFHTPQFTCAASAAYATSNGHETLTSVPPGGGFWVFAPAPLNVNRPGGSPFNYDKTAFDALPGGFNMLANSAALTVAQFDLSVGLPLTSNNFNTPWAWDASRQRRYFYSPQLEQPGAFFTNCQYASLNGFLDFGGCAAANAASGVLNPPAPALSLQQGMGFWIEKF